jgi:hypothetical protein
MWPSGGAPGIPKGVSTKNEGVMIAAAGVSKLLLAIASSSALTIPLAPPLSR